MGRGFLLCNEINPKRAKILSRNIERMAVSNALVTNEHPATLAQRFAGFFDRVLVDAPCSGEGMFRKEEAAVTDWSQETVEMCARRQAEILSSAAALIRPGGHLVYSTCTFSREENEDNVRWFLSAHPEFALLPIEAGFGRPGVEGLPVRRIYPMDGGEGHFVAKFQRVGENASRAGTFTAYLSRREEAEFQGLFEELFTCSWPGNAARFGDRVVLLPQGLPELLGLGVLRAGVELCHQKGKRWEPSHAVFQSARREDCRQTLDLPWDAPELLAFLRGEEIPCEGKGYTAVCAGGVPTGFGKASGGRLKNHYPKGLRLLS